MFLSVLKRFLAFSGVLFIVMGIAALSYLLQNEQKFEIEENPPPGDAFNIVKGPAPPLTNPDLNQLTELSSLFAETATKHVGVDAVVNIVCESSDTDVVRSITGSGVAVDPSGLILTNAHVAQHLLLEEFVSCYARFGEDKTHHDLTLRYIAPQWIYENTEVISQNQPLGTGEHDYAFMLLTNPVNVYSVFVTAQTDMIDLGDQFVVAGYPAIKFESLNTIDSLSLASTGVTVQELFTFGFNTLDLMSLGGSLVAEHGSSGGAVLDSSGTLHGIVVTATQEELIIDRDLRALTTGHINRSLHTETGTGLMDFLASDHQKESALFLKNTAPFLARLLLLEL